MLERKVLKPTAVCVIWVYRIEFLLVKSLNTHGLYWTLQTKRIILNRTSGTLWVMLWRCWVRRWAITRRSLNPPCQVWPWGRIKL